MAPPSLQREFWQHYTRITLLPLDLLQAFPCFMIDLALYISLGWYRWLGNAIMVLMCSLQAVQMWLVHRPASPASQPTEAYSPARRNALVLVERLLRLWALGHVALVFDDHGLKPAALGGPAASDWPEELFWACRVLVVGSGASVAFWQCYLISLPWWQELLLLGGLLQLSLSRRMATTAAMFSSWRPGGGSHYLELGKRGAVAVCSSSCHLVRLGAGLQWAGGRCRAHSLS